MVSIASLAELGALFGNPARASNGGADGGP